MKRHFLSKLRTWKQDPARKPLVIKGVRQVGKTYLLKKFGEEYPTYHYLNFEKDPTLSKIFEQDLNPKRIIDELSFHLDKPIRPKKDLVIFDEVQECPSV